MVHTLVLIIKFCTENLKKKIININKWVASIADKNFGPKFTYCTDLHVHQSDKFGLKIVCYNFPQRTQVNWFAGENFESNLMSQKSMGNGFHLILDSS